MSRETFTPVPPAGFEVAGTFNGVTTVVGRGGVPRIRYQLTEVRFPSGGIVGFVTRQVLKMGVGDEVALGGLSHRLATALMMIGVQPEAGVPERLDRAAPAALALGRYLDRKSETQRYGAMALVKTSRGMLEVLVTECGTEAAARDLVNVAIAPYR